MSTTKKITLAGILIAAGVVCSAFYIPVGVSKCFPVQSLINVLAGVLLGPLYAVCMAFATSAIRVALGTGSLLAFPGSMCGALLCGFLYKYTKSTFMAFAGEVIGTGLFGALLSYPVAILFLSKSAALFGFVIPFGLSAVVGAAVSYVFITALRKAGMSRLFPLEGKKRGG